VEIGRRHIASGQMFQNGPNSGTDVFIPLDHIIGGPEYAGKGWMMLMSALAAGRGISLPSLSAAATALSAHTAGAYSRVREQFGVPIGKFGGVQRRLGRLAAQAYVLDAARKLTCAGLDEGRRLAVISGIMKSNATYRMREAVNDAMDVHAGKTVIDGPKNYLGNIYRAVPVGITVEGANILTRNMIIFGQGAIRCHPHILNEMLALQNEDRDEALDAFDKAFWAHVGHTTNNLFKAWGRAWTGGRFAPAPGAGRATPIYRQLSRWASAFALTADMALLTLGGGLKRREMLSARMGDVLSELYLLSATLKRWEDEGRQDSDFPLVEWAAVDSFGLIRRSLDEVLANLPSWLAAAITRFLIVPGGSNRGSGDELTKRCAELLYEPSATRDRITENIYRGCGQDGILMLNDAFEKVCAAEPLRKKLRESGKSLDEARRGGPLTSDEVAILEEVEIAVAKAIAVDDFAPEEIIAWADAKDGSRMTIREAAG
jgi:acyl-CoA dehydrogenase